MTLSEKKLSSIFKNLPSDPGVYFFYGKQKEILYVGRATNLRSRVTSYFQGDMMEKRGPIIDRLISKIADIKFEQTDSVLESVILEANLIKKYQPDYNTKEKSNKSFSYLVITDEDYPRLLIKRQRDILEGNIKEKVKYSFGPFPSRAILEEALKIIRKIFPFYQKKNSYAEKSPFYKQIGLSPKKGIEKKEYRKNILNIKLFFEGKKGQIINKLEKQMKELAKEMNFEEAASIRNKISSLKHIKDMSLIKEEKFHSTEGEEDLRIEAYDISHTSGKNVVGAMAVVLGDCPEKSEYRKFKIKSFEGVDDGRALKEVLERRFSHPEWPFPDIIVGDGGKIQKNVIDEFLKENGLSKNIKSVSCLKGPDHKVKAMLGPKSLIEKYKKEFLLANSEVHRYVLDYHKNLRGNSFKKTKN